MGAAVHYSLLDLVLFTLATFLSGKHTKSGEKAAPLGLRSLSSIGHPWQCTVPAAQLSFADQSVNANLPCST